MPDMEPLSKVNYLAKYRSYLEYRANLIDLFTLADLPMVDNAPGAGNTNRSIGDIVKLDEFNEYAGYRPISFSVEEVAKFATKTSIITTRTQMEYGKYRKGEVYVAPWGKSYKVVRILEFTNLADHPLIDELTQDEKLAIGNNPFQVVYLTAAKHTEAYRGYNLFTDGKYIFGVDYDETLKPISYIVLSKHGEVPFGIYASINITKEHINNFPDNETSITTTYGRYLVNQILIAGVLDSVDANLAKQIPYMNKLLKYADIEKQYARMVLDGTITVDVASKYLDRALYLGSFGDMCVPGLSRKALSTHPDVKARKKELLEQHKNELDNPSVISKIEDELIAMDKEWLSGDTSMGFFGNESKKFDTHRKKLFLTTGLITDFTKEKGKYNFIPNSILEGWSLDSFADIVNDNRKGTYDRAVSTATNGASTKQVLRSVQNVKTVEDDCGTTEYLHQVLKENTASQFIGVNIVNTQTGELTPLTQDNLKDYIGKEVAMRSVMHCKSRDGYCKKCAGAILESIGQDALGTLVLDLTSVWLNASMKSFHGFKIKTVRVTDLSRFVV